MKHITGIIRHNVCNIVYDKVSVKFRYNVGDTVVDYVSGRVENIFEFNVCNIVYDKVWNNFKTNKKSFKYKFLQQYKDNI
jgi:hypothetical protein